MTYSKSNKTESERNDVLKIQQDREATERSEEEEGEKWRQREEMRVEVVVEEEEIRKMRSI